MRPGSDARDDDDGFFLTLEAVDGVEAGWEGAQKNIIRQNDSPPHCKATVSALTQCHPYSYPRKQP
jgi:hypothetical protein